MTKFAVMYTLCATKEVE